MSEYNQYRPQSSFGLPMVVKNLLIINVLLYLATEISTNLDFYQLFGLHFPTAPNFRVWQPITYLFMHGDPMHLFFNMFGLYMFGSQLEKYWGPKRFLTYYMITGIGAAVVHFTIFYFVTMPKFENEVNMLVAQGYTVPDGLWDDFLNGNLVVGASGAIFGLLLAFGMLFPNTELMMLFFPVPIKAKYFVIIYGLIELFSGVRAAEGDNVAHFAHLGGMLFGFILIKYWNKTMRNRFY